MLGTGFAGDRWQASSHSDCAGYAVVYKLPLALVLLTGLAGCKESA